MYKAVQKASGEERAIKVVCRAKCTAESIKEMFREVNALKEIVWNGVWE